MKRLAAALFVTVVGLGCEAGLISPKGGDTPVGTINPPTGSAPGDDGGTTAVGDAGGSAAGGSTGTGTAASGLPCNVQTLLQTRCQSCHSNPPKNGAPFALVSYADAMAHASQAVADMQSGVMPLGGPPATASEIQVLTSWIAAGFPMATTSCTGTATTGAAGSTGGGGTGGTRTTGTAGAGGTTTPPPPTTGTGGTTGGTLCLPPDVRTLMQTSCQGCHGSPPTNGAPFSLVSYNDVRTNAAAALSAMQSGAMPLGGPRATSAQIATLQNWINANFPSNCGTSTGGTGGTTTPPPPTTGTGGTGGTRTTGTGGAGGTAPPPPTTGTGGTGGTTAPCLPANVNNLVVTRCQSCHSNPPRNGAPFPLVTYNDVRNNASAALADMQSGKMPLGGPVATSTEIATLQNWINAGFPSGCGTTTGAGGAGGTAGGTGGAGGTAQPPPPPPPPPPGDDGDDDGEGGGDDNGGGGGGGNSGPGGGGNSGPG